MRADRGEVCARRVIFDAGPLIFLKSACHYGIRDSRMNLSRLFPIWRRYSIAVIAMAGMHVSTPAADSPETAKLPDSKENAAKLATDGEQARKYREPKKAETLTKQAVEMYERLGDTSSPEYALAVELSGRALLETEKWVDAENVLRRALDLTIKARGPEQSEAADAMNDLSRAVGKVGKLQNEIARLNEAEMLLRKAMSITETLHGKDHPWMVIRNVNLGMLLMERGKLTEAEPFFKRAIEIETLHPPDPAQRPMRPRSMLGYLYFLMGRRRDAESMLREEVSSMQNDGGGPRVELGYALHSLGELMVQLSRSIEAENAFWDAMKVREQVLGKEDPTVGRSLFMVAKMVESRGDNKNPESMYRRVLAIDEKAYGKESMQVIDDLLSLANNVHALGRYSESEALIHRAIAVVKKNFGEESINYANAYSFLAKCLTDQKRYDEADTAQKLSLDLTQKNLGDQHASTALAWLALGNIRLEAKRFLLAEEAFRQGMIHLVMVPNMIKQQPGSFGHASDLYLVIANELHLSRTAALDRIDVMREGQDPGPLPARK